jgi:DNA-binding beta-propeller fold protein YncE
MRRALLPFVLVASVAGLVLVACSGGGSLSGLAPVQHQPVNSNVRTLSLPLPQAGISNAELPGVSGFSEMIPFPANNAPLGTTLTLTISSQAPSNMPALATDMYVAQPFLYLTLVSNRTVTLDSYPSFTMTLPAGVKLHDLPVKIGYYDPISGWKRIGDLTLVGSTATFTPSGSPSVTLNAGFKYYAITYACAITKIFVTDITTIGMLVYDQEGDLITTKPVVDYPHPIVWDSHNTYLYVASYVNNTMGVYDDEGNGIPVTAGSFADLNGPLGIAFDSHNRHLYVTNQFTDLVTVYDEQGNLISTTGSFPNLSNPQGIAFDPNNCELYVVDRSDNPVKAYDEEGNQITTTGTFPGLVEATGIVFDSDNHQLYVVSGNQTVVVYDEEGNQITTTGTFPGLRSPYAIAFDSNNLQLYVTNFDIPSPYGRVTVYDEQGNQIIPTGNFINIIDPYGISVGLY